ncbi:MAG: DUF885 domain-containing protein [Gammaproteobacteria bacterium]
MAVLLIAGLPLAAAAGAADRRFEALATRYVDEMPALSPVTATLLGDHRYDGELDRITPRARAAEAAFYRSILQALGDVDRGALTRPNQVDAGLLEHEANFALWRLEQLRDWAWDPLIYTGLAGSAIYALMAREFAPLEARLDSVTRRLSALPAFLAEVRATLEPDRVPAVHAETAVSQNRGVLTVIEEMVLPAADGLEAQARQRLDAAVAEARTAIERHQTWLEETLLPAAAGDFRLGRDLFDRKLAFTLDSPLSRAEVRARAEREYERVRDEMYRVAKTVYAERYPYTQLPDAPTEHLRQAVIRAALEVAYDALPERGKIVEIAERQLEQTTAFVRDRNLVRVPDEPIEIIVMPEFQRGVAVAYLDAPGPLDKGQKTFYAVAPLPADWTEAQVESFLREYNLYSLQDLTIHEAMPGHYLQLAHANAYPSVLRSVLASGPFIEGWAVYAERLMIDEGYLDHDPLMRLVNLKWYLRAVVNAMLDQAIHVEGMTRDEAMRLMVEGAFQEESEAAGKWTRARLTSAQLSTYFVGYQEHADLRAEVEAEWGGEFTLRRYHDTLLSFGSPPGRYVRALMLDLPVPAADASGDTP